jgi:hypothetical protein
MENKDEVICIRLGRNQGVGRNSGKMNSSASLNIEFGAGANVGRLSKAMKKARLQRSK